MKCPKCGGTGFVPTNVFGVNGAIKCDFCDGTGVFITNFVVPMTNDEWRKTCSAEEFAEWITDKINAKLRMALHDAELYDGDVDEEEYMEKEDEWVEWLKEKHNDSMSKVQILQHLQRQAKRNC